MEYHKQKITGLLAGLLLLAGNSAAALEAYGTMHVSTDYKDAGKIPGARDENSFAVSSHQSHLGIHFTEALSGGLNVIGRAEAEVDADSGDDLTTRLRDTYAGLAGPFGEVRLGHYATAYKRSTEDLDVFKDTLADYNAVVGNVRGVVLFDRWHNNVIGWRSSEVQTGVGVFRFNADYIANANDDDPPIVAGDKGKNGWSLSASYGNEWLFAAAAYEQLNDASGDENVRAIKAGAGLLLELIGDQQTRAGVVYEHAEGVVGTGTPSRHAVWAGIAQYFDNLSVRGAVGWHGEAVSNDSAWFWGAGVYTHLSRTVELYLLYTGVANDNNGSGGLGQFQDQEGGVPGTNAADESVQAVSVGLIKRFGDDGRRQAM